MDERRSYLYDTHVVWGATMVPFGGWVMPLHYEAGTVTEHLACRHDAVVFDVSHLGTVRLDGPDAFATLQGTLTNDLRKISPGRAQYTHLLDDDGFVVDDIIVWWVGEDEFDVMPNASNTSGVREAVGGRDVTAERCVLAVQGPHAREVAGRVDPRFAAVGRFRVVRVEYGGVEVRVAGTGYTGEAGLEIAAPNEIAVALISALRDAGGPGRARHSAPRSGAAALRARADARVDHVGGSARVGPGVGQDDVPGTGRGAGRARAWSPTTPRRRPG